MKSISAIRMALGNFNENELIFASKLYREELYDIIEEASFYKSLERMCKSGELARIAKGTYHLPKVSKYGTVPPSESDIVSAFTKNGTGTIVGYTLYNTFNLTTQIPKTVNVLSSALDGSSKSIRNVAIKKSNLEFTEEVKSIVHGLEVLQNFYSIQDMNYSAFIDFAKALSLKFEEYTFINVIETEKYKKSTIAFMKEILDYYNVKNRLDRYLSSMSDYKYPKMEEIYAASRI